MLIKEMRIADVVATFTYTALAEESEVVLMIEKVLLETIFLMLFGLIVESILVFALIIHVIILSK